MRFGLLGDIHAEDARLEAALALFMSENTDRVLCVGDIADGRGSLPRTITLLERANVLTVRGNHDRWIASDSMRTLAEAHSIDELDDRARAWISALPATLEIDTPLGPLLLCHGVGENDMAQLGPHDEGYAIAALAELKRIRDEGRIRCIVGGHTHERMVRAFGELTFINPGTLRGEDDPCVAIFDLSKQCVEFFDFQGVTLVGGETFPLEPDVFPV